ncbi:MAG: hypothetical protein LBS53_09970 [Synergistaceae bacterium]|nr:hypothetical protein [Synergistaceae bacterium]
MPLAALTLFFLTLTETARAAPAGFDDAFSGYVTRMILALLIMGAIGYLAVKYLPGRLGSVSRGHIRVISALNLGRDAVYIVKTGPDVIAFWVGRNSSAVLGRWSLEEWENYEAASGFVSAASPHEREP